MMMGVSCSHYYIPVPPGVPVPVPVRLDNPHHLRLDGLDIGNYIKTLRTQYY